MRVATLARLAMKKRVLGQAHVLSLATTTSAASITLCVGKDHLGLACACSVGDVVVLILRWYSQSQKAVPFRKWHKDGGGATVNECYELAKAAGYDSFVLECPQCYGTPGLASCGFGGDYTADGINVRRCDAEVDSDGNRLGSWGE